MRIHAYVCLAGVAVTTFLVTAALAAADRVPGPVAVDVLEVHDGDTFTAVAHHWPEQYVKTHVRVLGIDTPEIRGRCDREKDLAQQAKARAEAFLHDGAPIVISNIQLDKYGGRVDADVYDKNGVSLARMLIDAKLGYAYDGGTKQPWCG